MDKQVLVEYIQRLVDMSGSKSSGEASRIELSELVAEITSIKNQLASLSSDSEALYYNEEEKLRDRQLEVQCQKRIRQIKIELEQVQSSLNKIKEEEEKINKELSLNSKSLSLEVIDKATKKAEKSSDPKVKEHYAQIIAQENERITNNDKIYAETQSKQQSVQQRMLELTEEIEALEKKLRFNEEILKETQQNLSDDKNYIDKANRQGDIAKKESLQARLKELEEKQKEIINDPVVLGDQAREALLKGETLTALNKVREIARQVGELPYMQVANDKSLELEELRLIKDRDDYFISIKGKKYSLDESKGIENRIIFLENCINTWEVEKDNYQREAASIDSDAKYSINSNLSETSKSVERLEQEVNEYTSSISACDEKDLKKKVELQASLNYKNELLNKYRTILDSYKKSLVSSINESKQLESIADQISKKINSAKSEIEDLKNGKLIFDTEIKDVLGKERDFAKLNELSKQIMAIKHRRKFVESPSDILQKFEQGLGFDVTPDEVKNEEINEQPSQETVLSEDNNASLVQNSSFEDVAKNTTTLVEGQDALASEQINPVNELASTEVESNNIDQTQEKTVQNITPSPENDSISIRPVFGASEEQALEDKTVSIEDTISSISSQLGENKRSVKEEQDITQSQSNFGEETNLSNLFNSDLKTQQNGTQSKVVNQEEIAVAPSTVSNIQNVSQKNNNIFDFNGFTANASENEQIQSEGQELKRVA